MKLDLWTLPVDKMMPRAAPPIVEVNLKAVSSTVTLAALLASMPLWDPYRPPRTKLSPWSFTSSAVTRITGEVPTFAQMYEAPMAPMRVTRLFTTMVPSSHRGDLT